MNTKVFIFIFFVNSVLTGCQSSQKSQELVEQESFYKEMTSAIGDPCVYSDHFEKENSCTYDSWSKVSNKSILVVCIGTKDPKAPTAYKGFCAKKTCTNLEAKNCVIIGRQEILDWKKVSEKAGHP